MIWNFKNTMVDKMLMHFYYLYEKSPKKCHEVVASLRQCLKEDDMPATKTRGSRTLRACEMRFFSHKVTAINRFIEHYDAMFTNGEMERYCWVV